VLVGVALRKPDPESGGANLSGTRHRPEPYPPQQGAKHLGSAGTLRRWTVAAEIHLRCWPRKSCAVPYGAGASTDPPVGRVAQLLTAIGALDDEIADRILADFDLALVVRQADAPAGGAWRRYRGGGRPVRFPAATPGELPAASARPGTGPASRLGQVIPLRAEATAARCTCCRTRRTEAGPQLSCSSITRQPPVGTRGEEPGAVHRTDDRGPTTR